MVSHRLLGAAEEKMKHTLEHGRHEMAVIRTSKATPALLDTVKVEAYGTLMPLSQVALVSAPEPRLLVVQPWDKSLIGPVEKAIRASDLGLNPANDGNVVRIPIPALTEERRKDLVKVAKHYAEEGRVSVRNCRRDANEALKKERKDGTLTEDQEKRAHDKIQEMTNEFVKEIDDVLSGKEREILEI